LVFEYPAALKVAVPAPVPEPTAAPLAMLVHPGCVHVALVVKLQLVEAIKGPAAAKATAATMPPRMCFIFEPFNGSFMNLKQPSGHK